MQLADKTVTLYRAAYDPESGTDEWTGTVLHNVSVHAESGVNITTDGLTAAEYAVMRIPYKQDVRNGDLVLMGAQPVSGLRPGDMADIGKLYTVKTVTDNTGKRGAHIKVVMA